MIKDSAEIVQAFPIQANTYSGVPNGFNANGYSIIHSAADADITFDFGTMGVVVISTLAGQDLAFSKDVQTITATAVCWIS